MKHGRAEGGGGGALLIKTLVGSLEMKRLKKPWGEECTQDATPFKLIPMCFER